MNKTYRFALVSAALLVSASMVSAGPRPSCDAPLAEKLLAGGCNSTVGAEQEFTPRFQREQSERSYDGPAINAISEENARELSEAEESSEPSDGGGLDSEY